MKIAIFTLGSRGDVQPYAVLGQALKLRGHEVTLATAKNFETLVKSYGLDFVPVEADYQALLDSEEGKKIMGANPFAIKRNLNTWIYPLIEDSLKLFYDLAVESDKVIYHVKTMVDCFADQFPHKMIRAMVVPAVIPTTAFANPAFSGFNIPSFVNSWTYKFTNVAFKMLRKPILKFRESRNLSSKFELIDTPILHGVSPLFLPEPNDYPAFSTFTGFWFGSSESVLEKSLVDFIESGEAPLLLTFGSMPFKSKLDIEAAILKVVEKFDTRIIVVKGWGLDKVVDLEENPKIKIIDAAPYEVLFPFVKAVIHHGGVGTTAECLRAGKPFFVCPILYPVGDQQFWGEIGYQNGVAVKPIPLKKMTVSQFSDSIDQLLHNAELYINAKEFAVKLSLENGLAKAINWMEKN